MPPSAEAFSWREGNIHVWTGDASASAMVAYAQEISVTAEIYFVNRQSLAGTYTYHETGRLASFQIGTVMSQHWTLFNLFNSGIPAHFHLSHSGVNGSAGMFLHSGRIDRMAFKGRENEMFQWTLEGRANIWSSYGG